MKRWEDNQDQCSTVKIVHSKLLEEETVLKISEQIKTDYGIGRIGLTDKRFLSRKHTYITLTSSNWDLQGYTFFFLISAQNIECGYSLVLPHLLLKT